MTQLRRFLPVGLVIAIVTAPGSVSGRQQLTISMLDALTLYELGEERQVTNALAVARGGDPEAVLRMLKEDVSKWIAAEGPDQAARRRMIAATFLLEVGEAGLDDTWEVTKQITEWACELLRKSGRPTELERRWHLTALALFEASFEYPRPGVPAAPALYKHLSHIKERFPDEPRTALAAALVGEYDYWTAHLDLASVATSSDPRRNESFAGGPIAALEKAALAEANRPEASLRMGFLEYKRGHLDRALELLRSAATGSDDETRVYLAHLFSAWTHEKAGSVDRAITSYRSALSAVNGLSAALGLGVHLYAREERDEADETVVRALGADAQTPDPYKTYGYGDFRRWPQLIAGLRAEALKR